MIIRSATFVKSAEKLNQCPDDHIPEIAFIGRSNVGKSSLINMLVNQKQLAKSSCTPGKTQLMNYFLINKLRHLVDLPGYSYARKSKEKRIQWMDTLQDYLTEKKELIHTFILVDGSIPLQDIDLLFLETLKEEKIPYSIIINKIDKTTQKNVHKNKKELIKKYGQDTNILLCSNTKRIGKDVILSFIEKLLG